MSVLISLQNIVVPRGDSFLLIVDSFDFQARQITILNGPNGSGKSTLLKTLALLQNPQKGTLCYAGRPVAAGESTRVEYRRKVTLVEQSPYLLRGTVTQNLAFGLKARGIKATEQTRRIQQGLEMVGLPGFEKRQAQELSGGEAKRVALARALALKPQVLLLDEPTANIDKTSLTAIENLLIDLPGQGIAVIMSSHDVFQAQRLSAKVVRLENGRLMGKSKTAHETNNHQPFKGSVWQPPFKAQEI